MITPAPNRGVRRPNGTGSRNSQAVLNEESVRRLRAARRTGAGVRALAATWGVSSSTVSRALNGQTWRHV